MANGDRSELPPGFTLDRPAGDRSELPPGFELDTRGIASTLVGYLSQGMAEMATAPFRGLHAAGEEAKRMREAGRMDEPVPTAVEEAYGQLRGAELLNKIMPKALYSGGYLDQPAPQTTGEKYAAAIGSGLSAAAAPELGLVAAGPRLARTVARGPVTQTIKDIGKFYAEKPGVALTAGGAAAATSAAAAESAKEADLGPGYQIAAGMVAPVAGVAPFALAGKAGQVAEFVSSRMGVPTITPSATLAGWAARGGPWRVATSPFTSAKAAGNWLNDLILAPRETLSRSDLNAQRILRRIGLPMSADEPPTATPTVEPSTPTATLPVELQETQARAYQVIANQLMRAGASPDDIAGVFNAFANYRQLHSSGLAQNTLFLSDVHPALTSLAGASARSGASSLPLEAVLGRQTGITPMTTTAERMADIGLPTRERFAMPETGAQVERRLGSRFGTPRQSLVPMGQEEVLEDAFRRALLIESQPHHGHQVSGLRTIERMAADRELAAGPAYAKTYAAGRRSDGSDVDFRPYLQPLLENYKLIVQQEPGEVADAISTGIRYFERALNAPELPPVGLPFNLQPPKAHRPMIERLDRAKRGFDEKIVGPMFKKPGEQSPWSAGVVNKFKNDVLDVIDSVQENNVGPLYKAARTEWSSRSETIDDIKLGMDAWKADSELGADVMRGANPNVRLGLFEGFRLQALNRATGADIAKLFDNKRIMSIIAEAIPKSESGSATFANRPLRFGGYVGMQQAQVRTLTEIARGSPTAARTQALQDLQDMHTIVETARKTGIRGFASEMAYAALNKFFGYRANTSEALARMLFTADEAANARTIEGIRQHMGPERFTYFTRLMAQMMSEGQGARGIVPAGAVATQQQPEAP